jgi:hypothetical protein
MPPLHLDETASKLVLRTRATGLLARFAHDLELVSTSLRGKATLDGDAWTAELTVPVASLHVAGVLHGDRLDPTTLSPGDRADLERKLREEVLSAAREITARGNGASRTTGDLTLSFGRAASRFRTTLTARPRDGGGFLVSGRADLSLAALGIPAPKGPMGAFKVSDAIAVLYDLTLLPGPTPAA